MIPGHFWQKLTACSSTSNIHTWIPSFGWRLIKASRPICCLPSLRGLCLNCTKLFESAMKTGIRFFLYFVYMRMRERERSTRKKNQRQLHAICTGHEARDQGNTAVNIATLSCIFLKILLVARFLSTFFSCFTFYLICLPLWESAPRITYLALCVYICWVIGFILFASTQFFSRVQLFICLFLYKHYMSCSLRFFSIKWAKREANIGAFYDGPPDLVVVTILLGWKCCKLIWNVDFNAVQNWSTWTPEN